MLEPFKLPLHNFFFCFQHLSNVRSTFVRRILGLSMIFVFLRRGERTCSQLLKTARIAAGKRVGIFLKQKLHQQVVNSIQLCVFWNWHSWRIDNCEFQLTTTLGQHIVVSSGKKGFGRRERWLGTWYFILLFWNFKRFWNQIGPNRISK